MHERAIQTLTDAPTEFANRPECRFELARSYFMLEQRDMMLSPRKPGPGEPGRGPPEGKRPPPDGPRGRPDEPGRGPPEGKRRPPPDGPPGRHPGPKGDHPAQRAIALLEQLVREFPKVPEYRHLLACCYRDIPPGRFERGQPAKNAKTDRGVDLLRQLVKDFPNVPDYRLDLCETLARPQPPARPGEANAGGKRRERLEDAIALAAQLAAQYPNVPDYAAAHVRCLDGLGMALFQAGKLDEAEKRHRKAVALQNRLVKRYPQVVAYRFWLGLMERSLGDVLGERGQLKEAQTLLESATQRVEALWKKDSRLGAHVRSSAGPIGTWRGYTLAAARQPWPRQPFARPMRLGGIAALARSGRATAAALTRRIDEGGGSSPGRRWGCIFTTGHGMMPLPPDGRFAHTHRRRRHAAANGLLSAAVAPPAADG